MIKANFTKQLIDLLHHYGFDDFELLKAEKKPEKKPNFKKDIEFVFPHEKQILKSIKNLYEKNVLLEKTPSLIYKINKLKNPSIEMHVIGAKTSVAEMILISAIVTSLRKSGYNMLKVKINSIGDADSKEKYKKELKNFFRKHSKFIPGYAQKLIQEKLYIKALSEIKKKDPTIVSNAPSPLDFLNDESREHMKTIFEFLDYIDVDYEIDPLFVGSTDTWAHTLFEIELQIKKDSITIAKGGRYTDLTQKAVNKKIETTGAIVYLDKIPARIARKKSCSNLFLAYLGEEAKIKALQLLNDLFEAGIPIKNSFLHHSLLNQVKEVKNDISHVIIIGHKEALENTAIIRNIKTNTQKLVPLDKVPRHVKLINKKSSCGKK